MSWTRQFTDYSHIPATIKCIKPLELSLFRARLNIVHVSVKNKEFKTSQISESVSLQNHFASFTPKFHFLEGLNLEDELNYFAKSVHLDLLIVMPRTYGPDSRYIILCVYLCLIPVMAANAWQFILCSVARQIPEGLFIYYGFNFLFFVAEGRRHGDFTWGIPHLNA